MNPVFATKLARRNLFRFGAAGLAGAGSYGLARFIASRPASAAAEARSMRRFMGVS